MAGAAYNRGASKQDYETPWELIHAIEARWGKIEWDLAATDENRKAHKWITPERDSLSMVWHKLRVSPIYRPLAFLNPPFNNIAPWAEKCAAEAALGARIVFLVPASVGSNWFGRYVYGKASVHPLNPRLSFDGKNPYPKDCMVCYYDRQKDVEFSPWMWKEQGYVPKPNYNIEYNKTYYGESY